MSNSIRWKVKSYGEKDRWGFGRSNISNGKVLHHLLKNLYGDKGTEPTDDDTSRQRFLYSLSRSKSKFL